MAKTTSASMTTDEAETVEVDINEATHLQLLWFSRQQMNLDVDQSETLNQTLSRLKGAWDHPTITVPKLIDEINKSAPAPLVEVESTTSEQRYGLPEMVTVQVHGSGDDNDDYQDVSHNGKVYRLKYGSTVEIPWYVYMILEQAKEIRYASGRDTGLGNERIVQSVAFTRVR